MKPHVKIYPLTNGEYTSQIYAGLYDLAAAGEISLELTLSPEVRIEERNGVYGFSTIQHIFYLELSVGSSAGSLRLCYDMMDNWGISSISGLEHCHAYFKRSFDRTMLHSDLPDWSENHPEWRDKIHPFGLNYPCKSDHEKNRVGRALGFLLATQPWNKSRGGSFSGFLNQLSETRKANSDPDWLIRASDLEVAPDEPTRNVVLLQTRLFEPRDELTRQINEERIQLVSALRKTFGDRFVGGFMDSSLARATCPQLITHEAQDRGHYLTLVKQCRTVVFTRGLVDSTGWRFGELLAASRCIVTEPVRYELPHPLIEGTHLFTFTFPDIDRCLAACDRLLSNESLAKAMQQATHRYYRDHQKPASLIRNTLNVALARHGLPTLQHT